MVLEQITREVIAQLQQQQNLYLQQHKARVKIVGFGSNCCQLEFNARGFTFEELLARVESCDKSAPLHNNGDAYAGAPTLSQLDALQDLPIPMLVDCSGQTFTKDLYAACLERGIHVSLVTSLLASRSNRFVSFGSSHLGMFLLCPSDVR